MKTDRILEVGCGNSRISESLSEDGYEEITNMDFSPVVINQMILRCKSKYPKMDFKVMNVLDMKDFGNSQFNVIFDKGTFDSVVCGENGVNDVNQMLNEIDRILVPGGKYICITYGDENHRMKYFQNGRWNNLDVQQKEGNEINGNKKNYFIYIMTK